MLIYTPRVGQLIALSAFVDDREIQHAKFDVTREIMKRAGEQIIQEIVDKHVVMTHDHQMKGHRIEIQAVVMTQKELKEALDDAYMRGRLARP